MDAARRWVLAVAVPVAVACGGNQRSTPPTNASSCTISLHLSAEHMTTLYKSQEIADQLTAAGRPDQGRQVQDRLDAIKRELRGRCYDMDEAARWTPPPGDGAVDGATPGWSILAAPPSEPSGSADGGHE